jgi:hypothetical protein
MSADEILARNGITSEADLGGDERTMIEFRKQAIRINRAALAELSAETAPPIPKSYNGAEFLSQPPQPACYAIDRLATAGGNVLIAAQFKAGKTTLRDNLVRSLCDLNPFLGEFAVTPGEGRVYVIDAELDAGMARRWLADQMIGRADRFEYHNIRAACSSFAITVRAVRREWAARIRDTGATRLLLDCLGPVLAALGLDENKVADVGTFLAAFEELLAEAGIRESWTVHHMGHAEERSRGASRLRDWPDAEWRLVRQDQNPASPRFLSAFGRDVNVPESLLTYDHQNRWLALTGGSRRDARTDAARAALLELLADEPDLSGREIEDKLCGEEHAREAVRSARRAAVAAGEVTVREGPRRAQLHRLSARDEP